MRYFSWLQILRRVFFLFFFHLETNEVGKFLLCLDELISYASLYPLRPSTTWGLLLSLSAVKN